MYQFVFYPFVDTQGEERLTPLMIGSAFKTSEAIQSVDREGRAYLQGFVILNKPMTPTQLRRASDAPSLIVLRVEPGTNIIDHRTRLEHYKAVCAVRGGVIYNPKYRFLTGDRTVFDYDLDDNKPPPPGPSPLAIRYEK